MYYGVNLFDITDVAKYRAFLGEATGYLGQVGGSIVCTGRLVQPFPQKVPGASPGAGQRWLNVTAYPEYHSPRELFAIPDYAAIQHLRDEATANYVWTYFEDASPLDKE